ncbi:MAG: Holliday junction resolvase RuvX [Alphaproteobacteria bacterium]|nr:MAG: Holliday junction resolvase RuvX [Alphaproteobacteria bacterium]
MAAAISDLRQAPETELPPGALMGLDLGARTIGIAVSDIRQKIVTPLKTLRRTRFTRDAEELLALARDRQVSGFVLGLPLNMDGSEGPRCDATRSFARSLARMTDLPILLWDERLSTAAAEETLRAAGLSHRRRAEVIDHVAAAHILQSLLDRRRASHG